MRNLLLLAWFALAVLAAGCSGGGSEIPATSTPTATAATTPEPSTVATPGSTPTAGATNAAGAAGYPAGTSTGIPALDALVVTLTSGDVAAVKSVLVETPSPCVVNPQTIHNPPACPDGVAAGTLLPVFRAMADGTYRMLR